MSMAMVEHCTYESLKSSASDNEYVILPFEVGHAKLTVLVARS
jgi:hypothetical protein